MCGFFTSIGTINVDLKRSTDIIEHRGPDSDGYLEYNISKKKIIKDLDSIGKDNDPKVLFGFRRLSIIDLSQISNQPFSEAHNKYHIVFNGEIYNYLEIKKELLKLGHRFITSSDTEVLLYAYIEWGKDCLSMLNGMWSFCILDLKKNILFCSRDRFGIKPFYYYKNKNGIVICSEIKQFFVNKFLNKVLNKNLVRDFLELGLTDHTDETFFKEINILPPAHYLEIPLNNYNNVNQQKYWDLDINNGYNNSLDDNIEIFKELFFNSIELRYRSDVEVGACLSGGLDSSSIVSVSASLNKSIRTFTQTNQSEKYSEYRYVEDLLNNYPMVKNQAVQLNEKFENDDLDKVIYAQDEPITSFGVLAQWKVMELAKNHNVSVLLDGQGADEVLGGYRKYSFFLIKELINNRQIINGIKELFYLAVNREFNFFNINGIKRYLNRSNVNKILNEDLINNYPISQNKMVSSKTLKEKSKQDINHFSYPVLLRYEDRNSMAFSIESRVPFLDYRLIEFLYSIPTNHIINNGTTKYILRESLKNILPKNIYNRKSKLGYSTPETIWLKSNMKEYFLNYFSKMDNPLINTNRLVDGLQGNKEYFLDSTSLIRVFLFDAWYNKHF